MTERQLYDSLRAAAVAAMANNKELGLEYHNSDHVTHALLMHDMLFGTAAESSPIGLAQKLAVLYHDVVYVPGDRYNEASSARFFNWQLRRHMGDDEYTSVHDRYLDADKGLEPEQDAHLTWCAMFVPAWIQCTTIIHHMSPNPFSRSIDALLDCDMAGMAKPYPAFKMQQMSIISEVQTGIGDAAKRMSLVRQASFLKKFYAKTRIYRTPEAIQALEDQARANIRQFIDEFKE